MPPSSERSGLISRVDAIADQVLQDVAFEKCAAGVVVFVGGRDQLRQPVRMRGHPPEFAGLERRVAFRRARIVDAVGVEGSRLPFWRRDLVPCSTGVPSCSDSSASARVAFLQAIVARLFGGALIDANAAAAHLVHHRQQIDVKPIGGARAFAIEDRVRGSQIAPACATAIGLGVGADIACAGNCQMYDCSGFFLLILKPAALTASSSSAVSLPGKSAPVAQCVEAVAEAVLVDQGRQRADLFELLGRRHRDAEIGAQPAPIIEPVLGDECERRRRSGLSASGRRSRARSSRCRDGAAGNSCRECRRRRARRR